MTQQEYDELVMQALHKVGQKLRGNREGCRQFLLDAGIILSDEPIKSKAKRKK